MLASMPPIDLAPVSGKYLSFSEREDIAEKIGRSPSAASRELRRNPAARNGKMGYRPWARTWIEKTYTVSVDNGASASSLRSSLDAQPLHPHERSPVS